MVLGAFVITQTKLSRIFNGSFATSELSLDHCAQLFSAIKGERGDVHPLEFLKHQWKNCYPLTGIYCFLDGYAAYKTKISLCKYNKRDNLDDRLFPCSDW